MLSAAQIAERLQEPASDEPIVITPRPNLKELRESGAASVDLRLGTWFSTLVASRAASIDVRDNSNAIDDRFVRTTYIPFGQKYVLHPHRFVLAVTLEWIRLPHDVSGDVVGKSSWGRHGLTVATATGVHPTFTGCLTLELSNIGEIPILLYPGMRVCQLFLHDVAPTTGTELSGFVGLRRPSLGNLRLDDFAEDLCALP